MDREIKPPITKTMTFQMLPDDLVLHCLARVSRLYFPTLCLVSKRFRSLVTSLEIYETRTLLGCTETCLYVFLQVPSDSTTRWFTLSRKPNTNPNPRWFTPFFAFLKNRYLEKEKNNLISVPTRNSPLIVDWWGLVTSGCNIYKIGTGMNSNSTRVIFMDCRSNTWCEAPSMRFNRMYPSVCVLDGKIYVAGGRKDLNGSNWMESFDPEACEWELVPSPGAEVSGNYEQYKWLAIEGKLYVFWNNGRTVVYEPKENRWEEVGLDAMEVPLAWVPGSSCVIDNVLYSYRWSDKLKWYDFEGRTWRVLKGLEKLYKLSKDNGCVRMVDYGGKIAVLWKNYDEYEENMIWCAEITIERRSKYEIYGKVEWCNVVLTVPKSCSVMKLLSVTL